MGRVAHLFENKFVILEMGSLLSCPDLRPARPLRTCNPLSSCGRHGSLFPDTFAPAHIDFPEGCQGS